MNARLVIDYRSRNQSALGSMPLRGIWSNTLALVEHVYDDGCMDSRNAGYGDPNLRYTTGPKFTDEEIVSVADARNVARRLDDEVWEVSWWPDHPLSKDEALQAVLLADIIGTRHAWSGGVDTCLTDAAEYYCRELGLTLNEAITLAEPAVDPDTRAPKIEMGWTFRDTTFRDTTPGERRRLDQ